jgi:hypothetical protein
MNIAFASVIFGIFRSIPDCLREARYDWIDIRSFSINYFARFIHSSISARISDIRFVSVRLAKWRSGTHD